MGSEFPSVHNPTKPKARSGIGKTSKKSSDSRKEPGEVLRCLLHGKGIHSTDDCKKIQDQPKRLETEHLGESNSSKDCGSKSKSSDKTWTRKASDNKKKTKSDLAAFIQKEVKRGLKQGVKELAAFNKKRTSSSDDDSSDDNLKSF